MTCEGQAVQGFRGEGGEKSSWAEVSKCERVSLAGKVSYETLILKLVGFGLELRREASCPPYWDEQKQRHGQHGPP